MYQFSKRLLDPDCRLERFVLRWTGKETPKSLKPLVFPGPTQTVTDGELLDGEAKLVRLLAYRAVQLDAIDAFHLEPPSDAERSTLSGGGRTTPNH
jgi:hypothetical protein